MLQLTNRKEVQVSHGHVLEKRKPYQQVILDGEKGWRIVREVPLEDPDSGELLATIGVSWSLQEAWNLSHILGVLPQGMIVCGKNRRVFVYNSAFLTFSRIEADWLETHPLWEEVLEKLRARGRLPEVSDWEGFKEKWLDVFAQEAFSLQTEAQVLADETAFDFFFLSSF